MTPLPRLFALPALLSLFVPPVAGDARAAAWRAIEDLPGRAPLTVQVSGAPRVYFRLTPASPLVVPVDGPCRLRVTSRVETPARNAQVVRYTITASDGAREIEHESTESSASTQARHPDPALALGKSRKFTIDVPRGLRRVTLSVAGADVLVRLHESGAAGPEDNLVSLTPVAAPRSVLVSEGEKTIAYYTALPSSPVRLRVVGPTTVDLLTRLDFDLTMRGEQTYRLGVTEGNRTLRRVEFRTSKATAASYTNLKDRVPSKFDRFSIAVGPGLHELAVTLLSPVKGAAEIHARIPQPRIGTEE